MSALALFRPSAVCADYAQRKVTHGYAANDKPRDSKKALPFATALRPVEGGVGRVEARKCRAQEHADDYKKVSHANDDSKIRAFARGVMRTEGPLITCPLPLLPVVAWSAVSSVLGDRYGLIHD